MYKYYSTQRPIAPGTYPKQGNVEIENYDSRRYIVSINRFAWGNIKYESPLTEKQISEYELVPDPEHEKSVSHTSIHDQLYNWREVCHRIPNQFANYTLYAVERHINSGRASCDFIKSFVRLSEDDIESIINATLKRNKLSDDDIIKYIIWRLRKI